MTEDTPRGPRAPTDADLIREHLQRLDLSQREAARKLQIDDRTMRYYCTGKEPVPPVVFFALRHLEQIRLNERALALLADGTMRASDGEQTPERLRKANETLRAATDLFLGSVRKSDGAAPLLPSDGKPDFMTPMLFQYVVALCCARRNPDAVDITIGDDVADVTTGAQRDVDVTVTLLEADGSRRAFKGYEVKREATPLDVTEVEQLCMKFLDMPDVTHRAIVSAAGYTPNAVKKAQAHGVQLFERKPWTQPVGNLIPELPGMRAPSEAFHFRTYGLIWADVSYYVVAPGSPAAFRWTPDRELLAQDGRPHPEFPNMGKYVETVHRWSLDSLWALDPIRAHVTQDVVARAEAQGSGDTLPWEHSHSLDLVRDGTYLKFEREGILAQIAAIHLSGRLQWQVRRRVPEFFILEDVITHEPFAATAIAEGTRENAFLALVFAPGSREFRWQRFELSDRQQNVIRRLKLLTER